MLLEICCRCGFVHKDERITYRAYKPHYHWIPDGGKVILGDITLHATICVACCETTINWKVFFEQKEKTPEIYRVKYSLNAPLPDHFLEYACELFKNQVKYFIV